MVADQPAARPPRGDLAGGALRHRRGLAAAPAGDPPAASSTSPDAGDATWHGFAAAIFARSGWADAAARSTPIATRGLPDPGERPAELGARLPQARRGAFGIAQPDWREALDAVVAELARPRQ